MREREGGERESNNDLICAIALCFVFASVITVCIALGLQNSANAAPASVEFNPVTIRNGAKIHVNAGKSLTAIDSGSKLVADNTNETAVKGDAVASSLSSFASENYGNDGLFKSGTASNPKSLSGAQINSFRSYLPTVNDDYWLSDSGSRGSIHWQSYANADNSLTNNTLYVTGLIDGVQYDETPLVKGPYSFSKDVSLKNYVAEAGGVWDLDRANITTFYVYESTSHWLRDGDTVYNNMQLLDSGVSENGYRNKSTTIRNMQSFGSRIFAYIRNGRIIQVKPGDVISSGTTVMYCFYRGDYQLTDTSYFAGSSYSFTGFKKIDTTITVKGFVETQSVYGLSKFYDKDTLVQAKNIVGSSLQVRPCYSLSGDSLSFFRETTSGDTLSTSGTFGDVPASFVAVGKTKKAVVKSSDTSISSSINASKISTDNSSNGHANVTYSNDTIKVPYGAKTLTLKANAFSTSNANYISGIADSSSTQKYAVLGKTGQDITIELASILNNTQVGSSATVSFYAEATNEAGISDEISATSVTVIIEVVEGPEQTIKYDNGGGTGALPSNAKVMAGKSYALADGSGLSKDGNLFSCWQLTYTPYGEADEVTHLVKSNEAIIVPDTTTGTIVATACYSGVIVTKSSDSKSSVITVTWNSNSPSGISATFDGEGTFNGSKTLRYDKVKLIGLTIQIPSSPKLSVQTKMFDGWYTSPTGGTKLSGTAVQVTEDVTYYAHWRDGYTVIWNSGTGSFCDNSKTIEEFVMPNNPVVGPKIDGTIDTPEPNDKSNYGFEGWYTKANGEGEKVEIGTTLVSENTTFYAYYYSINTFLAPSTSGTSNPRNIDGKKISLDSVKSAASSIKSGTNPDSNIYNAKNNAYHLYTRLKDSSGNYLNADDSGSWGEFRIVQVGGHDSDGTGLTFQSIHILPTAYYMNNSDSSSIWSSRTLYTTLNSGELYDRLDSSLTGKVVNLSNKGKFWPMSFSELTGATEKGITSDGSQYAYWTGKVKNGNSNTELKFTTRSGGRATGSMLNGYWWTRSSWNSLDGYYICVTDDGVPNNHNMTYQYKAGVVPCFSL